MVPFESLPPICTETPPLGATGSVGFFVPLATTCATVETDVGAVAGAADAGAATAIPTTAATASSRPAAHARRRLRTVTCAPSLSDGVQRLAPGLRRERRAGQRTLRLLLRALLGPGGRDLQHRHLRDVDGLRDVDLLRRGELLRHRDLGRDLVGHQAGQRLLGEQLDAVLGHAEHQRLVAEPHHGQRRALGERLASQHVEVDALGRPALALAQGAGGQPQDGEHDDQRDGHPPDEGGELHRLCSCIEPETSLGDLEGVVLVDDDDLAAGDEPPVDQQVGRAPGEAVEARRRRPAAATAGSRTVIVVRPRLGRQPP
ncbi:hypothetical protein GCM10025868_41800 [Angustibacter aerolatus]|uniref:Uncharacterized protein n=1 Tax=Angustibacter aerolatus TaxID=1162965 RepID=A0ABQ6JQE3_9ACTN|nr:hypothetical protein GCM10025868_41800 [Angustibacter aerolatus]